MPCDGARISTPPRHAPRPPAVVRGHAADGDQAVECCAERGGEAVDDAGAAAAVVDVVAGHDEEEALAVRVGAARARRRRRSCRGSSARPRRTAPAAASGLPMSRSSTQPLMLTTAVWNCGVDGSQAWRMIALRPSRYVRVVASADSFITRTLTIDRFRRDADVLSGGERGHARAVRRRRSARPCRRSRGAALCSRLVQREVPTVTDCVASNPAMTRGCRSAPANSRVRGQDAGVHDVDDRARAARRGGGTVRRERRRADRSGRGATAESGMDESPQRSRREAV